MEYTEFLDGKAIYDPPSGLSSVPPLSTQLFPFQRDIVAWALRPELREPAPVVALARCGLCVMGGLVLLWLSARQWDRAGGFLMRWRDWRAWFFWMLNGASSLCFLGALTNGIAFLGRVL